jgi:hypothetical protein
MEAKFGFTMGVEPLPQADAFNPRGLPPALVDDIKRDIIANNEKALGNANATGWQRVLEAVEKMQLRLDEYARGEITKFYSSWIDNVTEVAALIPSINVTNDADLNRIRQRLVALTAYSVDDLKADTDMCSELATEAAKVLASIKQVYKKAA